MPQGVFSARACINAAARSGSLRAAQTSTSLSRACGSLAERHSVIALLLHWEQTDSLMQMRIPKCVLLEAKAAKGPIDRHPKQQVSATTGAPTVDNQPPPQATTGGPQTAESPVLGFGRKSRPGSVEVEDPKWRPGALLEGSSSFSLASTMAWNYSKPTKKPGILR